MILAAVLLLMVGTVAGGSANIELVIPLRDHAYAPDVIVAGSTLERGKIILENQGSEPLNNVSIEIKVPHSLVLQDDVNKTNAVITSFEEILPGESKSIVFSVKPPDSIPVKEKNSFEIKASYIDSTGWHTETFSHEIEIIPPPSWAIYGTVLASIIIIIFALVAFGKFHILERFTTVDLITIALLAALSGVVFRWFWQTFNDLLGPFGGLAYYYTHDSTDDRGTAACEKTRHSHSAVYYRPPGGYDNVGNKHHGLAWMVHDGGRGRRCAYLLVPDGLC